MYFDIHVIVVLCLGQNYIIVTNFNVRCPHSLSLHAPKLNKKIGNSNIIMLTKLYPSTHSKYILTS